MKFLALSVSALLSTLVYSSSAAAPANVYFFSHGCPSTSDIASSNGAAPSLNLKETRATLAHLLNLDQRPNLQEEQNYIDMQGPIQLVFNRPGMSRKNLFETMGGNLMMVIEGVDNANDLLPSFEPAFTVDSSEGIQDMVTELGNSVPSKNRYLFNTHKSSKSGDALVNEHLVADHHANVDVTVFDLDKRADALFLEESVSLGNYIDSYEKSHSKQGQDFVRITIKGLSALAAEHGVDSVQYKTAKQILKEFLQETFIPEFEQIHKTYTATIFLVEPNSHNIGSESFEASSSSPKIHPMKKRALPLSSTSCFATEADCQTNTNGCNTHGACVFSIASNCYHCKCDKINNTQYGGNTCDKIDISVQFHLFFWLGLGLVLTVALAVGLILQMGNDSQGGVPVGPTRAQLKRD
ncbi:hypothetical protein BGZ80_000093 [Entomortierella chlamydospora]|uniref:DUF3844 domain-containing protein n=1 Tax=Entomortierella chlamydospora TaxID=101097 RepID=A0A9P6SYY9_9FUNG|nr:hypothetical protein BGZ79_005128 [Entomortierella chlamydospora]KAG0012258.1 hypothetical protein BGZ80_000093 [Entomortierella chlamydospora]